jgi:lactoylglutathione lyase
MITGLAHICFTVRDLDASEVFYRDRLGFKPAFDFVREDGRRSGLYLHVSGRTFIELFQGEVTDDAPAVSYKHICLEADDLKATVSELRAAGVAVTDPEMGSDHSLQAWLADPDGNRIELHQYTPESKQAAWLEGG